MNAQGMTVTALKLEARLRGMKIRPLWVGIVRRVINKTPAPVVVAHNVHYDIVLDKTIDEAGNLSPILVFDNLSMKETIQLVKWFLEHIANDPIKIKTMPCIVDCVKQLDKLEYDHIYQYVYKPLQEKSK